MSHQVVIPLYLIIIILCGTLKSPKFAITLSRQYPLSIFVRGVGQPPTSYYHHGQLITMESHHFFIGKSRFFYWKIHYKSPFSIAISVYQAGYSFAAESAGLSAGRRCWLHCPGHSWRGGGRSSVVRRELRS